jgi:hypothetical protein
VLYRLDTANLGQIRRVSKQCSEKIKKTYTYSCSLKIGVIKKAWVFAPRLDKKTTLFFTPNSLLQTKEFFQVCLHPNKR